jgi:hypothetical protein
MNALEFSTKIKHGIIKLPSNYENEYENVQAKVIILFEKKEQRVSQKEAIKKAFDKMKGSEIFADIQNPVEWQKQLRNEWE